LEPATLSPLLKRLEQIGYLTRARDVRDERTLCITLTSRGRELRTRALEIPPAVAGRLGMAVDDLRSLHAMLTEVITRSSSR
jgi:DNA-binding MarR family transcriptional regulator